LIITLFPYYLLKMPSSPPTPPPANANTRPANAPETKTDSTATGWGIASMVFGIIFAFVWHLGAASLSYAKYGSIGWAILDFFFATFYYPFYAFVLNTPPAPTSIFGGRRRLPKLF
jgi:hypothetical protein